MKRLSAHQYATALDSVLATAKKGELPMVAARFLHRLRRDRAMRSWPRILDHVRALEAQRRGRTRLTVEAASIGVADAFLDQVKKADATIIIDPRLRRGLAVTVDDRRIDASLDGRLQQLHRSLVTS